MTGDKIAACVAIIGMLALVVPRLASDPTPKHKLLRMAALWVLIVGVITAIVLVLR